MVKGLKGVHHVGMGVKNYDRMKAFYGEILKCTDVYGGEEFPDVCQAMPEMFRQTPHKFKGIIFRQEAGGVYVEFIKMSYPIPRPIRKEKRYGDIGVNKMSIVVDSVKRFYEKYKGKIKLVSEPKSVTLPKWGEYHFVYGRDPEGNLLEFMSWPEIDTKNTFGGVRCLGIGCTNLEESIEFYQNLSFDKVLIEPHEEFSGMVDEVSGTKDTKVRSCVLESSEGGGMVELYELLVPRGRSIPLNTMWGDFGMMEVCLDSDDIHSLYKYYLEKDIMILHSPAVAFSDDDVDVWFMYAYDPSGIPVEALAPMPAAHNIYKHA